MRLSRLALVREKQLAELLPGGGQADLVPGQVIQEPGNVPKGPGKRTGR